MALKLILNGHERTFDALTPSATITALVSELGVKPDRIAIEQNGDIVPRTSWPQRSLALGDRIEIVHFVGGGSR